MVRIKENIDIAPYTSFGTHARVERLVEWDNKHDLVEFLRSEGAAYIAPGSRWTILGEGCNTLFTKDFAGTILRSTAKGIEILEENEDHLVIRASAGEVWDDVVAWCCERGLWGAENLSAIPSSVGASAVQNIGAYGVEAKDIIDKVEYIDITTLEEGTIKGSECKFGYRESIFKHELSERVIITAVCYRLSKHAAPHLDYGTLRPEVEKSGDVSPMGIRRAVVAIRDSKLPDPKKIGNAGSFFKNPILPREQVEALKAQYPAMPIYEVAGRPECLKIATGWMIDSLGWKGQQMGRAGVHKNQALVLINCGDATGSEVMALAERICEQVSERFGVEISPEVNIL